MTRSARLVALACLVFVVSGVGGMSCDSDPPKGGGSAGNGGSGAGDGGSAAGSDGIAGAGGSGSAPSRGPTGAAGTSIVVIGGSGGAAGAAAGAAGTGSATGVAGASGGGTGDDGGSPEPICPDGVRGNDIACDATVDVICISDCMNNRRIRCGCTGRGPGGDDRWVCGGQPQDCP